MQDQLTNRLSLFCSHFRTWSDCSSVTDSDEALCIISKMRKTWWTFVFDLYNLINRYRQVRRPTVLFGYSSPPKTDWQQHWADFERRRMDGKCHLSIEWIQGELCSSSMRKNWRLSAGSPCFDVGGSWKLMFCLVESLTNWKINQTFDFESECQLKSWRFDRCWCVFHHGEVRSVLRWSKQVERVRLVLYSITQTLIGKSDKRNVFHRNRVVAFAKWQSERSDECELGTTNYS